MFRAHSSQLVSEVHHVWMSLPLPCLLACSYYSVMHSQRRMHSARIPLGWPYKLYHSRAATQETDTPHCICAIVLRFHAVLANPVSGRCCAGIMPGTASFHGRQAIGSHRRSTAASGVHCAVCHRQLWRFRCGDRLTTCEQPILSAALRVPRRSAWLEHSSSVQLRIRVLSRTRTRGPRGH